VGWYLAKLTLLPGREVIAQCQLSRKYEIGENNQQNRRNRKEERREN
jgi:hypothetical protein